ncbi:hypothetical protein PN4B1_27980 [Paenibacillus naphthalenovorans]|uniref:hypothetical protein n=1 Tax=Paenibacillus naphthalenovorans TaxID=162209 RepID=UPI0010B3465B|nr:hypothetical protein [Paenibacillus naphthalenovorans]GCL72871.1 hypothetical protein PN4B1_27980 [Paenibacillus naphthalenovorans]
MRLRCKSRALKLLSSLLTVMVLELGKKLTRTGGGIHYIGYDTGGPTALMRDLALPVLDSETGGRDAFIKDRKPALRAADSGP